MTHHIFLFICYGQEEARTVQGGSAPDLDKFPSGVVIGAPPLI